MIIITISITIYVNKSSRICEVFVANENCTNAISVVGIHVRVLNIAMFKTSLFATR